jgi:hypothetical protein
MKGRRRTAVNGLTRTETAKANAPRTPTTSGADAILADYVAQAAPKLARLGEIADKLMSLLREPPRLPGRPDLAQVPIQDRVKYLSSLVAEAAPGLVAERGTLAADLYSLEKQAEMSLLRWLENLRAAADEARAADPDSATPEGQARKLGIVIQAGDLSQLPTDRLIATGQKALAEGDIHSAQVRLAAARLRDEPNQHRLVSDLAAAVERALDATMPHRQAAVRRLEEAHRTYGRVRSEILLASQLASRLARDPSPTPETGPGFGSTPAEQAAWNAEGHEHVMAKLRDWFGQHPVGSA